MGYPMLTAFSRTEWNGVTALSGRCLQSVFCLLTTVQKEIEVESIDRLQMAIVLKFELIEQWSAEELSFSKYSSKFDEFIPITDVDD